MVSGPQDTQLQKEAEWDDGNSGTAPRCFSCTQCKAKFSRLAHLKRHQKSHRPEKPFSCLYCPVSSTRKDVIIRHTRNFHPEKVRVPTVIEPGPPSTSPPFHLPSIEGSVGSDRTTSDEEHQSTNMSQSRASRRSCTKDTTVEDLGGYINDLAGPISEINGCLDLEGSDLSVQNMFDAWEALPFPDQGISQIFEYHLESPAAVDLILAEDRQGTPPSFSLQPLHSQASSSLSTSYSIQTRDGFFIQEDKYRIAKLNYESLKTTNRLSNFRFPSIVAASRFIRGFFEYMAPHMPIVHVPTFDIASTAPPLLIEIMACGALYADEPDAAEDLHSAALVLMREHDEIALFGERDRKFELWLLQASILICYFGAFSGDNQRESRAAQTLSHTMKLADDAFKKRGVLNGETTYGEWVHQETLNRCLAGGIILSAALFSKSTDRCFSLAVLNTRFPLPSSLASWHKNEDIWEMPKQTIYSTDVLKSIFDGRKIALNDTDFGFATIVSAVVCHICVFESLVGTQHPDVFAKFVERMDGPVQMLKETWKKHSSSQFLIDSTITQMAHTARSMILSMGYHLYASQQLVAMKQIFHNQEPLGRQQSLCQPSDKQSATLRKALAMAAEMLRSDCQIGLGYIKSFGHVRFAPLSVIAPYEGVLLLSWYLQNKSYNITPDPILDTLINEAQSETATSARCPTNSLAAFPLTVYARLFNPSVWQFHLDVSHGLTLLAMQLENTQ